MMNGRDIRAVYRLLSDIRALGGQADRWPTFALDGIRRLLDGKFAAAAVLPLPPPGTAGPIVPEIQLAIGPLDKEREERHNQLLTSGEMTMGAYFKKRAAKRLRFSTLSRDDVLSDEEFYADPASRKAFTELGVDHFLHSEFVALSIGKVVGMFVLREVGAPRFGTREKQMFKLFHLETARMWKTDLAVPDDGKVRELSPRQKQVLWMLCSGDSEKRIAMRLNISGHTVHDYVKAIYKHFQVSSRNELLVRVLRHPSNPIGEMSLPPQGVRFRRDSER